MKKYGVLLGICFLILLTAPMKVQGASKKDTLNFELYEESDDLTNQEVTVSVELGYSAKNIVEAKWEFGKKTSDYCKKNGEDLFIKSGNLYFFAEKNGIYTVYLKDNTGKEGIQTIKINNIDMTAPKVTYKIDGSDRSKGKINLQIEENYGIEDIVFYYGKLTDPSDTEWLNGNPVSGYYFIVYKNGIVSVRVRDKAGNATIVRVNIDFINSMNLSLNYGLEDKVQIFSYYGELQLVVKSIDKVMLLNHVPAYRVNYYVKNVKYDSSNCFTSNQDFRAYDKNGNELRTSNVEFDEKKTFICDLPKVLEVWQDSHSSFIVIGEEKPTSLDFYYWDENLSKQSVRIECSKSYKQQVGTSVQYEPDIEIEKVKEVVINDSLYSGTLVNGKEQGLGKREYRSGAVYYGEFYEGKEEGYGIYTTKGLTPTEYRGEFINNKYNGFGILKNGYYDTYTGLWSNDIFVLGKLEDINSSGYIIRNQN